MKTLNLDTGWQLAGHNPDKPPQDWLPATVPGVVHQDLMAAGRIPDPFYGLNENLVQWVGERDWVYRCTFTVSPDLLKYPHLTLCFDGLDTFATVSLNGQSLLTSDNMFVPHRVPAKNALRPGRNELQIVFESALHKGREIESHYGRRHLWNGDSSRLYVRKAQYHYGWDWGPTLLTAGPWRGVRLEAWEARIAELHCPADVSADLGTATLPVSVKIEGHAAGAAVQLTLLNPAGQPVGAARHRVPAAATVAHTFTVSAPELWWPNGHGPQPLYTITAALARDGDSLDEAAQKIGLRRLRLVQEPLQDESGSTFLFEINNRPIFCGGANWIPADNFTPRITRERYRQLLQLAAEAHMTMLRVWGGGIYEDDAFYDLCDELGLLVWQDFMFACGLYPAHPDFVASVQAEAEANVRRLRRHPSLALWCGNNEDYQIANSIGAYDPTFNGDFGETQFPARHIYEHTLPEVCAALDPARPYWRGSPYGGPDGNSLTEGDAHIWGVWHGQMARYQDYPKFAARFVSEFGMMSFPALKTIESFAPPEERQPFSRTLEHHNKAGDGVRRLIVYVSDTVRVPYALDEYVYATQLMQAEALAAAYRGWRRRWGGPGRYATAGALVWQLEDCWPVSSWAIVDSALRAKPAYYAIRRELAPLSLGLARTPAGAEVWAVNNAPAPRQCELALRAWSLEGELLASESRAVALAPNQATELGPFKIDFNSGGDHARRDESETRPYGQTDKRPFVIGARLMVEGETAARAALWPEPFKYLHWPEPQIDVARLGDDHLQLRAARPAKGLWLDAGDGVQWSDNLIDLLPGDAYEIVARGLGEGALALRWLGGAR